MVKVSRDIQISGSIDSTRTDELYRPSLEGNYIHGTADRRTGCAYT